MSRLAGPVRMAPMIPAKEVLSRNGPPQNRRRRAPMVLCGLRRPGAVTAPHKTGVDGTDDPRLRADLLDDLDLARPVQAGTDGPPNMELFA